MVQDKEIETGQKAKIPPPGLLIPDLTRCGKEQIPPPGLLIPNLACYRKEQIPPPGLLMEALNHVTDSFVELISVAMDAFGKAAKSLSECFQVTPVQSRRAELWERYKAQKAEMSNNERRRRGLPMVRRPKRKQWITYGKRRAKK